MMATNPKDAIGRTLLFTAGFGALCWFIAHRARPVVVQVQEVVRVRGEIRPVGDFVGAAREAGF